MRKSELTREKQRLLWEECNMKDELAKTIKSIKEGEKEEFEKNYR